MNFDFDPKWLLALVFACNTRPVETPKENQRPTVVNSVHDAFIPLAAPPPPAIVDAGLATASTDATTTEPAAAEGVTSRLWLHTPPRSGAMDAPEPKTTIRLTSRSTDALIMEKAFPGEYHALAFSRATSSYVLGIISTVGAWRGLVAVLRLDEHGALRDAKGPGQSFFALAAVASDDGDMIAFVSQTRSPATAEGFRLQLLDVARDRLRDLGVPPAPPPEVPEMQSSCKPGRGRGWADQELGGFFEEMDPNIITFTDGKVRVSYGADTCKARAKKRTTKEWLLPTQ